MRGIASGQSTKEYDWIFQDALAACFFRRYSGENMVKAMPGNQENPNQQTGCLGTGPFTGFRAGDKQEVF